jgi:hypothetical protein
VTERPRALPLATKKALAMEIYHRLQPGSVAAMMRRKASLAEEALILHDIGRPHTSRARS